MNPPKIYDTYTNAGYTVDIFIYSIPSELLTMRMIVKRTLLHIVEISNI